MQHHHDGDDDHAPQQHVDDAIRDTPEYRAAWDVELWKALQLKKLERELKTKEKQLFDSAKQNAALKEKQLVSAAERKLREVQAKEQKLIEDTIAMERRRQKIIEGEKDLKRRVSEVEDHRRRVELDADDRVRRVKEDGEHRVELINQRLHQSSQGTNAAEERLAQSQKEYLKLWEEFSDFKTKVVTQSGPHTHQLDAMRAQHAAEMAQLTERSERRFKEATLQFQGNTQHLHQDIRRLTQNYAHKKEQLKTVSDEASLLRQQREESARENDRLKVELKRVVDVCRQQTQQTQWDAQQQQGQQQHSQRFGSTVVDPIAAHQNEETQALRRSVQRATSIGGGSGAAPQQQGLRSSLTPIGPSATATSGNQEPHQWSASTAADNNNNHRVRPDGVGGASQSQVRDNIARWKAERGMLLRQSAGVYDASSPLIVELDHRILEAANELQHGSGGGGRREDGIKA